MGDTQILPAPPTTLLRAAHQRLHELLDGIAALDANETAPLRTSVRRLRDFLLIHFEIEETLFYPALREAAPEAVEQARQEHERLKSMLSGLDASDVAPAAFRRAVIDHLEHEEAQLFPAVQGLRFDAQCRLSLELERLRLRLEGER